MARTRRPLLSRRRYAPVLELLEDRSLLSSISPFMDVADTLTHATYLSNLNAIGVVRYQEEVGNSAVTADVDWYRFQIEESSQLSFTVRDLEGTGFDGLVSVYSNDPSATDLAGAHRLLGRGAGTLDLNLAPGFYDLAVSGAGNEWFNPLLADSGFEGERGAYELVLSAERLNLDGTVVLGSNVPDSGAFDQAPLGLYVRLNADIDLTTSDVQLVQMQDGMPVDWIPLQTVHFSADTKELQVTFNRGLNAGSYQLAVFGGEAFDLLFAPLGFQVVSIEGGESPNDTASTAHDLGDIQGAGIVTQTGLIGNNPFYEETGDPTLPGLGADLDIYRFQVTGAGRHGFIAEVFANRVGSNLDAGLTLFQIVDGQAVLLGGNNNTLNATLAADGSLPLYADAALFSSLTAGEYYVVVSSGENALDPGLGAAFGPETYDPVLGLPSMIGYTTGFYVLNLQLLPSDNVSPRVIAVSISPGEQLEQPLETFTVQFSEAVNLQQLAFQQHQSALNSTSAVFIAGPQGQIVYPRLVHYDAATFTATFLMMDRLTEGNHELHISGEPGLTDFSGNPLVGASAQDAGFIMGFSVAGAALADPLHRVVAGETDSMLQPQELGTLFSRELEAGIVLQRDVNHPFGDNADYFRFTVLQPSDYSFRLQNSTVSGRPTLLDASGNAIATRTGLDDGELMAVLMPGTYVIKVAWDPESVPSAVYELNITVGQSPENPTPLTQGPAPVLRLHLVTNAPPTGPSEPIRFVPPATNPTNIIPALLANDAAPQFTVGRNPAGALGSLAAGPVGVFPGAVESQPLALRLSLPSYEFAAKEGPLVSRTETPDADTIRGPMVAPELDLWWRLVEHLFQTLQQMGISSLLTSPSVLETSVLPSMEAGEAGIAAASITPQADASFRADAGPQSAWGVLFLAAGGMTVMKDRSRRPLKVARGRKVTERA